MNKSFLILLLIFISFSCQQREWDNPFDPDCPKELFSPSNLQASLSNNQVNLSWKQANTNITGFQIERSVAGGNWTSVASPVKSATSWSDANLSAGKVHSYRLVAKAGSNTSNPITTQITPVLTAAISTSPVTLFDYNAAMIGGTVIADGGAAVTQRGVCYGTSQNPTVNDSFISIGSGMGSFSSVVTGLLPNTTYTLRSYAINSQGFSYGTQVSFKTTAAPSVSGTTTDLDGNIYNTITIGNQVWMAENLKTTKFSDGTSIPNITDFTNWAAQTTPAFCWFNNDAASYKNTYGALYNWYAVSTGKIAPPGWHVATLYEWTALCNYLGGTNVAGAKIKLKFGWDQNLGTNSSGFSLLPAGFRASDNGSFQHIGYAYNYWLIPDNLNSTSILTSYILTDWASMSIPTAQANSSGDKTGKSIRCVKDVLPTIATNSVSSVLQTTATCGGTINYSGGQMVTSRGVCWSTSPNPTTSNSKTSDGTGLGTFSSNLTGLEQGITYYVRAYATNSVGTAYGNEVSFKTSGTLSLATLTTNLATSITSSGAIVGGNITSDGNATVTERGIVYATTQNPTTSNAKIAIGSGIGSFATSLAGLVVGTTYYVRAYATNSVGTAYGNQVSFTTTQALSLAALTTNLVTNITSSSATFGGTVNSDGNSTVTERGVVLATTQNPTTSNTKLVIGSGIGSFSNSLSGLAANTTYYVRAYATNSVGTAYGNQVSFTTYFNETIGMTRTNLISSINPNQWHYIAITKSAGLLGKLFIDGKLISIGTWEDQAYVYSQLHLGASFYTT